MGPLVDVCMFRRAARLGANGAGRVGGMPTTPVPSAHREHHDCPGDSYMCSSSSCVAVAAEDDDRDCGSH